MEEVMKRFYAGEMPSPYVGDTPKFSTIAQLDNRVQVDNLVGHDSHVPAPPVEPVISSPQEDMAPSVTVDMPSVTESTQAQVADEQTGSTDVEALYANVTSKEKQHVFYVQGKSSMLVVDHGSNGCFS